MSDKLIARILPWESPEGKPCFLSARNSGGVLARIADEIEAAQTRNGVEVLTGAKAVLADSGAESGQLRFALARVVESLRDVLRVAHSRGARLTLSAREELQHGGIDITTEVERIMTAFEHPTGTFVVDLLTGRVGQVMDLLAGLQHLRPINGGTEWSRRPEDLRLATPDEVRKAAERCDECTRIKGDYKDAFNQGKIDMAVECTELMGCHLREAHS